MTQRFTIGHRSLLSPVEVIIKDDGTLSTPPYIAVIEPTARCNLKCPMCPHWYVECCGDVELDDMDIMTYLRTISMLKDVKLIALTGFGEPYLHPGIFEFIRFAKKVIKGVKVAVTTNGVLLNEWRAVRSIESGMDYIEVSYEGFHGQKIYRGIDHTPVVNALNALEYAVDVTSRKIDIVIAMVLGRSNVKDLEGVIKLAAKYNVSEIRVQPIQIYFKRFVDENIYKYERVVELALKKAKKMAYELGISLHLRRSTLALDERGYEERLYLSNYHQSVTCIDPFVRIYVSWNGEVLMCCGGMKSKYNIKTESMWNIWNSSQYKELRRNLIEKKFHGLATRCGVCNQIFGNVRNQVTLIDSL